MNIEYSLPPRIRWTTPGSFGMLTITRRFPKILTDVIENNAVSSDARSRLADVLEDIIGRRPLVLASLDPITPFWRDWIAERDKRSATEMSFLEVEYLFYHAINSLLGVYYGAHDPFASGKNREAQMALAAATTACIKIDEKDVSLSSLIHQSLTGNVADLSQLEIRQGHSESIPLVIDQSAGVAARIAATTSPSVALVADNVGAELFADLLLIHHLLARQAASRVDLYVKPWPMFVSDATRADAANHVQMLCRSTVEAARLVGEQLSDWLREGKLNVHDEVDWREPKDFAIFEHELSLQLRSNNLVICKGDLNYRRWFDDRDWPMTTPLDEAGATLGIDWPTAFLRVLKSEIILGCPETIERVMAAQDALWRTNGQYGIVQVVG